MKYLRYKGEFLDRQANTWRAEIYQEADAAYKVVGDLDFDADPLELEWKREDKENVICGSTATLQIVSPSDRTYEDLYSIAVGQIRLDVYRNNTLYWSGALDPEFYEEPYESYSGYTVSLTFSDFGILDRIKYDLSGMRTLREILQYAIQKSTINTKGIDVQHVTTTFDDDTTITGGAISVRSENFTDEDGEASTLKDVIEGILQPLAIRMVQRAGMVYLYDLNGLYTKGTNRAINWDGDSQTMGVDKVCNNVKVSFSPYSSSKLMDSDALSYKGKYDVNHVNLTSDAPTGAGDYGEYYSYYPDYSDDHKIGSNWDYNLVDFTIFLSNNAKGLATLGTGKYFQLQPVTGGVSDTCGVAYAFRTGGHGSISTGWPKWKVHSSIPKPSNTTLFKTNKVFLPALDEADRKNYRVRVCEELLLDARYNPFSGSTEGNDEKNDKNVKVWSGFVFIPAKITLYDEAGTALYHYSNKDIANGGVTGHLSYAKGTWEAGADPGGDCFLEYYNPDDLKEDCGIRGWQGNRHCIGRPDGTGGRPLAHIYDSFAKMDDGEYMPYPPCAGYLEVEIQTGVSGYEYGNWVFSAIMGGKDIACSWDDKKVYNMLRWCLYKLPVVDVVNYNLAFDAAELDDVEYSGYVNKAAKEEISIDTICGTSVNICPTAKGIYCKTSDGFQLQQLKRADRTDHPEKLLIGTLYSQYAERKTSLSGEAVIDGGLHYYTEANQGDKRFLLMSDTQKVIECCTDAEYVEFVPDEYDDIEEMED